jgi:hypothetical protein
MVPWNFRERPKTPNDFEFGNRFAIMPIKLGLYTDFETGVKAIGRNLLAIRNSYQSFGMYYLACVLL